MSILLVDWLGQGGIAQTTEAWSMTLTDAGAEAIVVTRGGRELEHVIGTAPASGRLRAHRAVATLAAARIRDLRPEVVVVQNYMVPILERPVYRAAIDVGARLVLVVHDHRMHERLPVSRTAGMRAGLRGLLRAADVVVTHTRFVGDAVERLTAPTKVRVIPHPVQVGVLAHQRARLPALAHTDSELLAIAFGSLWRPYKGTATVARLAEAGVPGWRFAALGRGARPSPRVQAVSGYLEPGQLAGAVEQSDATLLPYSVASQSGAVVLAQVLGSVPIATAVGGLPEQIEDGVSGFLVPPASPVERWRGVLEGLTDARTREAIAAEARARAWQAHEVFRSEVTALCGA